MALATAGLTTRQHGLTPLVLGDTIEDGSREVAVVMAGIARSTERHGHPISRPVVLLSDGETTVIVNRTPSKKGNRNTEFSLSLACTLQGKHGVWAMAGNSDGVNGIKDAAGTIVFPGMLARSRLSGFNAVRHLDGHNSYCYFHALNDLLITGPTLTDTDDTRVILIA